MSAKAGPGVLRVPEHVLLQNVADEAVFLNLDTGTYYGLDAIGTRMAQLLLKLPDEESVVRQMEREYDTTVDVLRADVTRLIAELETEGLVERTADAGAVTPTPD
jgi:hypothetical protein